MADESHNSGEAGAARSGRTTPESAERLMAIISSATDAIITVDDGQNITLFNAAAERMFRCPAAEAMGRSLNRFIPDRFREIHGEHIRLFAKTGVTARAMASQRRLMALRADGVEFPVEATISQIVVGGQRLFTAIIRDVSERRRAEEIEAKLAAIIESLDDGIIGKTLDGVITTWNGGAERIFGYTAAEAVGRHVSLLIPAERREEEAEILQRLRRGERIQQFETVRIARDGRKIDVSLTVSPIKDSAGVIVGASKIVRDISERKREGLLRAARDAAEAANRAKSQFLANMSHELRTPLNAIIGYSEMLLEDLEETDRHAGRAADLEKIRAAGKQLLSLINDILDLSKIEAGKTTLFLELVDVPNLVREVVTTIQPAVVRTANRLEVKCPASVGVMNADPTKIRQTLLNLLSNALKFTDHGLVSLEVSRAADAGREWIDFVVRDTGIGMSAEQTARLFQVFSQAEETTSVKYGGTGLGLAISRRLCRLMGGEITVSSELGKGSVFTARLPVIVEPGAADSAASEQKKIAPLPPPAAAPRSDVVLVVDDDPIARDLLVRTLSAEGYNVRVAAGGAEGLELARKLNPVAITLDLLMPGVDGWTVLTELKGDAATADIPVIVVTIVDDEGRAAGATLGACEFLTKPVDRRRLAEILAKHRRQTAGAETEAGLILVVEDIAAARELTCHTLRAEKWEVMEACDGLEALAAVARRVPRAIILDLMMPNMDGFEFVAELRRNPAWREIPIVVLTAKVLSDEDRRRLNGGVQKIMAKGAGTREELMNELQQVIKTIAPAHHAAAHV